MFHQRIWMSIAAVCLLGSLVHAQEPTEFRRAWTERKQIELQRLFQDNSPEGEPVKVEDGQFTPVPNDLERVLHLRTAAKSLLAGGFADEAAQLQARADEIEEQLRRRSTTEQSLDALVQEIRALRRSVEDLRQEVASLRRNAGLETTLKLVPNSSEPGVYNLPPQTRNYSVPTPAAKPGMSRIPVRPRLPSQQLDEPIPGASMPLGGSHPVPEPTPASTTPATEDKVEFELVPIPAEEAAPVSPSTPQQKSPRK